MAFYNFKRKAPIKRNKPLPKRTKSINKQSEKSKEERAIYIEKRDKFIIDNPYCMMKFPGCTRYTQAPQHTKRKGKNKATGENYNLDTKTWIPSCNWCNQQAEKYPELALEMNVAQRVHTKEVKTYEHLQNDSDY